MEKSRQRMVKTFLNVLSNSKLSIDEMILYSSNLENECFNHASNLCNEDNRFDLFKERYSDKIGQLLFNINAQNNPNNLIDMLKNNLIGIDTLVEMEPRQLNPVYSLQIENEIKIRESTKIVKKYIKDKKCKFCQEQKVSFYEKQTRSLDEPKTIFYECDNCENTWK